MVVGESRTELLNWLNELLQLNFTKVEQCGTGAAYCQIMDSIYQDIPISKIKFELNSSEYNYLTNFKILQSSFVRHKITKPIPVERLIKCKFQDNLEFLQWIKKFWMENKDESPYDPVARRSGVKGVPRSGVAAVAPQAGAITKRSTSVSSNPSTRTAIRSRTPSTTTTTTRVPSAQNGTRRVASISSSSPATSNLQQQVKTLTDELSQTRQNLSLANADLEEYKVAGEGLETERNFYFNKLREIEILTQSVQQLISNSPNDITVGGLLNQIEEILYSTEEGFQIPEDENETDKMITEEVTPKHQPEQMILDEETF